MTSTTFSRPIALDINGTLETGGEPLPGALELVEQLTGTGRQVLFATNTTTVPASAVASRLRTMGFGVLDEQVYSAATATTTFLKSFVPARPVRVLFLGEGEPFDGDPDVRLVRSPSDAHVAVLGGAASEMPLAWFEAFAAHAKANHLPLVAMHANKYERRNGQLRLDSGVLLPAVAHIAGSIPVVVGKPAEEFFRSAARLVESQPSEVLYVGDDIDNDVVAAQKCEMTGVLVRTGKYQAGQESSSEVRPDFVVDDVGMVLDVLQQLEGS